MQGQAFVPGRVRPRSSERLRAAGWGGFGQSRLASNAASVGVVVVTLSALSRTKCRAQGANLGDFSQYLAAVGRFLNDTYRLATFADLVAIYVLAGQGVYSLAGVFFLSSITPDEGRVLCCYFVAERSRDFLF